MLPSRAASTNPSRTHSVVQKVAEKKMKSNLKKFVVVPALSLILAGSIASAQEKMECKGPKLSQKQVKALIASAKTAEDHNKLACYYRAEAKSEEKQAKYHEEMGELYKSSSNAKHDMVTHCKQFADEARKAAEADNQLAAEHEKMAEEVK
jgi:hypothetical protein